VNAPDIFWFPNQPNDTPERLTDAEGRVCWEAQNSAWSQQLNEKRTAFRPHPEPAHAGPVPGSGQICQEQI